MFCRIFYGEPVPTSPENALERQSSFARRVRERLDTSVIQVSAAVEDHFLDTGLAGALGEQLAELRRLADAAKRVARADAALRREGLRRIEQREDRLDALATLLESVSHKSVLQRG